MEVLEGGEPTAVASVEGPRMTPSVVTVPAYFSDAQRQAAKEVLGSAGASGAAVPT